MDVPTIDLKTARDDADALKLLDSACRDHGFFIMINHGID